MKTGQIISDLGSKGDNSMNRQEVIKMRIKEEKTKRAVERRRMWVVYLAASTSMFVGLGLLGIAMGIAYNDLNFLGCGCCVVGLGIWEFLMLRNC